MANETRAAERPSLRRIADVFVRYANFTFGGGSATVAVLHRALKEERGWLNDEDFKLCFGLARLTPGTNLLAFCTGVGWMLRGVAGAAVALLAASLPCSILVVVVTALFSHVGNNPWAQSAIKGAVAAAVAITVRTSWVIAQPHMKGPSRNRSALIAMVAFISYVVFSVPAVEVLLLAGAISAVLPAMPK